MHWLRPPSLKSILQSCDDQADIAAIIYLKTFSYQDAMRDRIRHFL
jgi:hypothetical protein